MCGPLCDAVLELSGSATVLAEVEQSNLLLVPLDRHKEWYRYHYLCPPPVRPRASPERRWLPCPADHADPSRHRPAQQRVAVQRGC
jgi:hypothetical protein